MTTNGASGVGSLSVVIPIYNAAAWVEPTVSHVMSALAEAGWTDAEVIVVNDGSTDGTAAAIEALPVTGVTVRTLTTENRGRFLARQSGLDAATGEFAFLIDARVFVDKQALAFLVSQLHDFPNRRVWNGHTRTATSWKPWTRFWNPITFIAWRRYLGHPRITSFGIDDYDHYPKGTGLFFAPRQQLIDLCAAFDSSFEDISKASDDTLLIKPLATSDRINLAPQFGGVYFPRDSFRQFVQHSYFRGTTFVDGHLRPGSRFNRIFWGLIPPTLVVMVCATLKPRLVAKVSGATIVATPLAMRAIGVPLADGAAFACLAPVFVGTYGVGIIRGLILRYRAR